MTPDFMPLNADRHRHLKLRQHQGYAHARQIGEADLMLSEFGRAALHYPIVFAAPGSSGNSVPRPVALLSRQRASNAFVAADGRWTASYVPLALRLHPFTMARVPGRAAPLVCIDARSELLSHDDGVPLFDIHGDPAPALEHATRQLEAIDAQLDATAEFCRALQELHLLVPCVEQDRVGAQEHVLDAYLQVDPQALEQLGDAALCLLRRKGWLMPLYAHCVSLMQFARLPQTGAPVPRAPAHPLHGRLDRIDGGQRA